MFTLHYTQLHYSKFWIGLQLLQYEHFVTFTHLLSPVSAFVRIYVIIYPSTQYACIKGG